MNKSYVSAGFVLGSSLCMITSCNKSNGVDPTPAAIGAIVSGVVLAQDEVLQPMSKGGSTVMIEGTDKKALTDAQGSFELRDLKLGKYVLNVSRAGMGTLRYELEIKSPAPVDISSIMLDQESSTQVLSMTPVGKYMHSLADEVAAFECQIAYNPQLYPAPKLYSMMLFLGNMSEVSNTSYVSATQLSQSESTPAPAIRGIAKMRIAFHTSSLNSLGFARGDKVYVIAYGAPRDVASGGIGCEAYYFEPYSFNPATGQVRRVVANLNAKPVRTSFTMP
ncbi:carboxypeptidase-like regulatory domain-containing protein [Hymenobacter sp. AT01-02]|uniref:carboxypeptidase-like regulatory domain-containing protein n=1 Tax=Hymenobacter sp. AT01-02 TaxID=1571877 RepID=UPI0005F19FAC|nr:carboxypeptidase-like regulatory domain-containing protein [Hymenobacter sp. AT01-02]